MSGSGSLLSRFVGGALTVSLGNFATLVLGLLATMVAARHLPAEAFGAFVLVQVVASFLTQVSSFGLNLSITKFAASTEDERHKGQLINTAMYFRLFMSLVIAVVAFATGPLLSTVFDSSLPPSLAVFAALLFLLDSSSGLLKSILQSELLFKRIAMTEFIASLFNLLLIRLLVLVLDRGLVGLMHARLISLSLSCAFAYLSIPTRKRLEFRFDLLKEVLAFGFPLHINDILTFVFQRIDTLVIGALLGPTAIAYFEIARRIPDSLARLYEGFRSVYFAFMSRLFGLGEQEKAARVLNNSTRMVSLVTALGALTALLFGNDMIVLLFSEQYLPSVPAFVLLMINLNIRLVSNVLGTSSVSVGDSKGPAITNAVHMAVNLLSNLILIPVFGIVGAALASLASVAVSIPLNTIFLRRSRVQVRGMDYLKPILLLGVYTLLFLLLKPSSSLQKASLILLFIVACILLSIITREELAALLGEAKVTLFRSLRALRSAGTRT